MLSRVDRRPEHRVAISIAIQCVPCRASPRRTGAIVKPRPGENLVRECFVDDSVGNPIATGVSAWPIRAGRIDEQNVDLRAETGQGKT
jgi:hypothetical protein